MALMDSKSILKHIKDYNKVRRHSRDPDIISKLELMNRTHKLVDSGLTVKDYDYNEEEVKVLKTNGYLTAKPEVYLINVGKDEYINKNNKWLPKIEDYFKKLQEKGGKTPQIIPFSADFESKLNDLAPDDKNRQELTKKMGAPSAVD